ncbi:unnamed protein product [Haemonchus placei]|uniref:Uncharacterized protein n=1 Tax=Haemonchus placei TaxID=6290 RepID=A0A0N4W8H8_HAEPC|nr:unnamed protein product [Haemonchus placei]
MISSAPPMKNVMGGRLEIVLQLIDPDSSAPIACWICWTNAGGPAISEVPLSTIASTGPSMICCPLTISPPSWICQ